MNRIFTGTIQGKVIMLDEDPHLPSHESVEVRIRTNRMRLLRKAIGAWRGDKKLDESLKKVAKQRYLSKISPKRA
jgi:hypothetical protein